LVYTGTPIITG